MAYDERDGGPYDRGRADYWYHRAYDPHYFKGATHQSELVELANMTPEEIAEYTAGYRDGEADGTQKDWGE